MSQTRGRSPQHGRLTRSVRGAQRQGDGRIQQVIQSAGTVLDVDDFEWNANHRAYKEFPFSGTPGLSIESYDCTCSLVPSFIEITKTLSLKILKVIFRKPYRPARAHMMHLTTISPPTLINMLQKRKKYFGEMKSLI